MQQWTRDPDGAATIATNAVVMIDTNQHNCCWDNFIIFLHSVSWFHSLDFTKKIQASNFVTHSHIETQSCLHVLSILTFSSTQFTAELNLPYQPIYHQLAHIWSYYNIFITGCHSSSCNIMNVKTNMIQGMSPSLDKWAKQT